jgi:hypothetical protein
MNKTKTLLNPHILLLSVRLVYCESVRTEKMDELCMARHAWVVIGVYVCRSNRLTE